MIQQQWATSKSTALRGPYCYMVYVQIRADIEKRRALVTGLQSVGYLIFSVQHVQCSIHIVKQCSGEWGSGVRLLPRSWEHLILHHSSAACREKFFPEKWKMSTIELFVINRRVDKVWVRHIHPCFIQETRQTLWWVEKLPQCRVTYQPPKIIEEKR